MSTVDKERLPLPINFRNLTSHGLVFDHQTLAAILPDLVPNLTEREQERLDSHLTELLESLVKGKGHLPKDVVPTPGKGEMTHILNGRLLRRDGIWVGLCFGEDRIERPLEVLSITRGYESELQSMLSSRLKNRSSSSNRKFHQQR